MQKRVFVIVAAIILACAMCITSQAISEQYKYEVENVTIIFEESTTLSEQEREVIVNHLTSQNNNVEVYGLWCNLFGHSYESHTATKITHCVYETDPRCLEEIFKVQVCSRCENTISESMGSVYISCCPEE